jgi:hypothetical protein
MLTKAIEEPPDEALQIFRGLSETDEQIHNLISWTTLESYPLRIGISLPVPNQAMIDGEEVAHEAQLWEETTEEFIIEMDHTAFIYNWLSNRFRLRSSGQFLPERMPESVNDVAVQIKKDGTYGCIIFAPLDSLAESLKEMDVQVVFEYDDGFMKIGMGEAYTLNMLVDEFHYLTRESWLIFPTLPIQRIEDGSVVHGWTDNWAETAALLREQSQLQLPPRIIEDRSRGALICKAESQTKLIKYWSRIQRDVEVGVYIPGENKDIEYWMGITVPFEPDAEDAYYPGTLMDLFIQNARILSPEVAQWLTIVDKFAVQTRYAFNSVRVWYCPKVLKDGSKIYGSRVKRPLAEESAPKDKWITAGPMAFTRPPTPDGQLDPITLFGPTAVLQERYDDEEVRGGKIALIAVKQIRAQKPPNGLDRTQSTFSKQVAYNKRILEAEKEILEIAISTPQFLMDMNLDEPVYVCVNSSEEMNRNERSIAGQLWIQGDRSMTASNLAPDGMADTKDSALLAAVAEAVSWNHASQPDQPRQGQRIVIYPEHLTQMDEFLTTCDPNGDQEGGHSLAYNTILQEQAKYENTPIIVNESSEFVTANPILSQLVPDWMSKAEQIATGCRHRTLEDGRDVMNSDEEDDENMVPDTYEGAYTAEMLDVEGKLKMGPVKLSSAEANRQRLVARVLASAKASTAKVPTASQPLAVTPDPTMAVFSDSMVSLIPFDPDSSAPRSNSPIEPWMDEKQRRKAELATQHLAKNPVIPRSSSSPSMDAPPKKSMEPTVQAPAKGAPLEITKVTAVPAVGISKERTRAAASTRAPADQPKGAEAPPRKKETQVSPPMETRARKKASRAGGLRGVDGLGQTEIGVDHKGPPSKT